LNKFHTTLRRTRAETHRKSPRQEGFTLIELMVVMTIILILIGIAAANYQRTIIRTKEAALLNNLRVIRDGIDNYTLDKQAAPQSLDDLVQDGYLREVPVDPMTRARDWVPEFDSVVLSPDQTSVGMRNVHSNSAGISPFENTPYNQW